MRNPAAGKPVDIFKLTHISAPAQKIDVDNQSPLIYLEVNRCEKFSKNLRYECITSVMVLITIEIGVR